MNSQDLEQVKYSPALTQKKKKEIEEFILSIENDGIAPFACGAFKTVYANDDLAYYCESAESSDRDSFESKLKVSSTLKSLGISTPQYFYTTQTSKFVHRGGMRTKLNHRYTVCEKSKGLPIWFQKANFCDYYSFVHGVTFSSMNSDEFYHEFYKQNIATLKNRATKFKPTMPKFFRDFYVINSLGVFNDVHGGNILQDPSGNYSFVDLNYARFPAEVKNSESLMDYLHGLTLESYAQEHYNDFFSYVPDRVLVRFLDKCLHYWNGISAYGWFNSFYGLKNKTSEELAVKINEFVYSGILLEQAKQMLDEFSIRFNTSQFISDDVFKKTVHDYSSCNAGKFMSPNALKLLYKTLEYGDSTSPRLTAQISKDLGCGVENGDDLKFIDFSKIIDFAEFSSAFKTLSTSDDFDFSFLSNNSGNAIGELSMEP